MDAVSEVLVARAARTDGLSSMLGASAMAHIVLVGLFVFLPAAWFGAEIRAARDDHADQPRRPDRPE